MQQFIWYIGNKKGECPQEFNFEFSETIQAVSNCEPKDIKDILKISMYAQNLSIPAISLKTIRHGHPTFQKPIDYAKKTERQFLLIEGIQ